MKSIGLSKSKIIAGLQCPKRLWLQTFKPELIEESSETQQAYAVGNQLGELARDLYPDGKLIGNVFNVPKALADTQSALAETPATPLFEGAFQYDGVLIRADLLFNEAGKYRVIEVKSSTSVKDYHLKDCAIQSWVMESAGLPIKNVELGLVDSSFVYQGDGDYHGLLRYEGVTEQIQPLKSQVQEWVSSLKSVLSSEMPEIQPGNQCTTPFECPFYGYCNTDSPEYPITLLSYGKKFLREMNELGIVDVRDVPESSLTTQKQHRIWEATVAGKALVAPEIFEELAALPYPRYYLDFETIGFVIPIWRGTRPYQSLPFQWSCHVEPSPEAELEHLEFLDISGNPPMRPFAESLIANLGESGGPILVYSSYEAGVIKELIGLYPDLSEPLRIILSRLYDLLPLMQKYYYHPAMKGSWSIKAVLPTIAPELDYKNLEGIQNGLMAQSAYLELIRSDIPADKKENLVRNLLKYCELDTYAMVALVRNFK